MDDLLSWTAPFLGLIITQLLLGKKASFPYGILLGFNLYVVSFIIIITDILLMLAVDKVFKIAAKTVFPFTIIYSRLLKLKTHLEEGSLGKKLLLLGRMGALIITAIPFAGGVWSGVIVARILNLQYKQTYMLVGVGTVIGCGIFLIIIEGLIWVL
jgi:uncharacterized membrane protein